MKSTHCLYTAVYSELIESTDPRDIAELERWQLHGRRAEQFLKERFFLRRCFNHYLEKPDETPLPATSRLSHGKPYFAGDPAFFNLTNTGQALLVLLSHDAPVGVDAELQRSRRNLHALARKVLGPAEWAHFCALGAAMPEIKTDISSADNAAQLNFFLQRWTWRECLLKASGVALAGLSGVIGDEHALNQVASPLNPPGIMYSYLLSDLSLGEGWFTVFPGDDTGNLLTRRYVPQGDSFTFTLHTVMPQARAQVNVKAV